MTRKSVRCIRHARLRTDVRSSVLPLGMDSRHALAHWAFCWLTTNTGKNLFFSNHQHRNQQARLDLDQTDHSLTLASIFTGLSPPVFTRFSFVFFFFEITLLLHISHLTLASSLLLLLRFTGFFLVTFH